MSSIRGEKAKAKGKGQIILGCLKVLNLFILTVYAVYYFKGGFD